MNGDVGTPRPIGLPQSRRRYMDRTAEDMQRTLQPIPRNLEVLCADVHVTLIEDLPKNMQMRVVGVPIAWILLLRRVATLVQIALKGFQLEVITELMFTYFVVPSNFFWDGITIEHKTNKFYKGKIMYFESFMETTFTTIKESYIEDLPINRSSWKIPSFPS